jgi:hypothetical protein
MPVRNHRPPFPRLGPQNQPWRRPTCCCCSAPKVRGYRGIEAPDRRHLDFRGTWSTADAWVDTCRAYIIQQTVLSNRAWICGVWAADEGHLALLHGRSHPAGLHLSSHADACRCRRVWLLSRASTCLVASAADADSPHVALSNETSHSSTSSCNEPLRHFVFTIILILTLRRPSRTSHGNMAESASEVRGCTFTASKA